MREAKEILSKDLQMAEHIHLVQKEHQKLLLKKPSLLKQLKVLFNRYF